MTRRSVYPGVDPLGQTGRRRRGAHGCFLATGSAPAELGVWVLPWMQIVGPIGNGVMGNLAPGRPFDQTLLRTPVLGIRVAWGCR